MKTCLLIILLAVMVCIVGKAQPPFPSVPTGRTFYVERVIIQPTSVSGLSTAPSVSLGKTASAYTDVLGTTALTALIGTGLSSSLSPIAGMSVLNGGDALKVNVTAATLTTTYTFKVIVTGTLL